MYLGRRPRQPCGVRWTFATPFSPSSTHSSIMHTLLLTLWPGLFSWSMCLLFILYFPTEMRWLRPHASLSITLCVFSAPCLSISFRFPTDPNCQTIDQQFLWGSSLLISPVLERGAVELAAYLPPGTWYSMQNVSRSTLFSFLSLTILPLRFSQPFQSPVSLWDPVIFVLLSRVSLSTVRASTCSCQPLWTPSTSMSGRDILSPSRCALTLEKLPISFCWAQNFLYNFWFSGRLNVVDKLLIKCLRMGKTHNT